MGEVARISVKVDLGMRKLPRSPRFSDPQRRLDLARVLLVHGELAPRLTLQTILQAGGYSVDVAATPAEASAKLDSGVYELVLSELRFGTGEAGPDLLAYARVKDYRPATALITASKPRSAPSYDRAGHQVSIHTENLPGLLGKVADLIGLRASRRHRPLRQAV